MEIVKLNQSRRIKILTNVGIALIILFAIASFAQYYSLKLNFVNPLLPEYLFEIYAWPLLRKGIILLVALIVIFILKYFKRNLFAFSVAILIIAYYIFSDHYIGGWHTQIK